MLKFLNILPYGYERVSKRDNDDARWNILAINEPNALNPAYVIMNEKIYKKATYEDDTTAEEKAKAQAIQAFSDANAVNNAVNINYNQLVDLQKQSALKNFVENRGRTEKLTTEEQKDKVLLTDQFRKIINYTKDLQNKGIDLVDGTLNDDIREYYNILSRLKAPVNNPLVGLNKNRDYTNMNIYDNIESMASNSTGVFSSKDIIAMSSVDNIPQKVDKLEVFARGIKYNMSNENRKFLEELKDLIAKKTNMTIPSQKNPKNEIEEIGKIVNENSDDDELIADVTDFLANLDDRRQEKLTELEEELKDLEFTLSNRQEGLDYTMVEEAFNRKLAEYEKIRYEGTTPLPPYEGNTPDVSELVSPDFIASIDADLRDLMKEDLTLEEYERLYEAYNAKRDEYIRLTNNKYEYPDMSGDHEEMIRLLTEKRDAIQPEEEKQPNGQRPRADSTYYTLLDEYINDDNIDQLKKLENMWVIPSNSDEGKLVQAESRKIYSLVLRRPNGRIDVVDSYRAKSYKQTRELNIGRKKFYDVINTDNPPPNSVKFIDLLDNNKVFYDMKGKMYTSPKTRTESDKKEILYNYLVQLGELIN
jgi:hypothetical protein